MESPSIAIVATSQIALLITGREGGREGRREGELERFLRKMGGATSLLN